jgi:hypothetical protein
MGYITSLSIHEASGGYIISVNPFSLDTVVTSPEAALDFIVAYFAKELKINLFEEVQDGQPKRLRWWM